MNPWSFRLSLALAAIAPARADLEFSGILATGGRTLFALHDTATTRSDWVALHGGFAGYVLSEYDRATDTLTLTRAGETRKLRLKDDAKVQSSRLELTGSISFGGGEKVDVERATLLFDQENVFPLKDGVVYRITPSRRPDGNHLYQIVIEQRSDGNRLDRLSAPAVVVLPHQAFRIQVGEFGFSFAPK